MNSDRKVLTLKRSALQRITLESELCISNVRTAPIRASDVCSKKYVRSVPSTTVSSAPPAANAITGRPQPGFDWSNAKIFFPGEDECSAAPVKIAQVSVAYTSQELDVAASTGLKVCSISAISDDFQRKPETVERVYHEVNALIGNQSRRHEKEVVGGSAGRNASVSTGG